MTYGRLLCAPDGFEPPLRAFADEGGRGCNVTMPFKFEAYHLVAGHTPRGALAGACNALRLDAGHWLGDNTDGAGLLRDIERNAGVALLGRRVLLVGAGGAAAGALGPLLAAGPAAARRRQPHQRPRGRAAARAPCRGRGDALGTVDLRPASLDRLRQGFDVVVNATASSMLGAAIPIDARTLRPGTLAIDMMYGPSARAFRRLGRGARRRRARRARHARRAGGRSLRAVSRRAPRYGSGPDGAAPAPGGRRLVRGLGVSLGRLAALVLVSALALQLYFLLRVALMRWSTRCRRRSSAPRSGGSRPKRGASPGPAVGRLRAHLSEPEASRHRLGGFGFTEHSGVEWDALEKAWERNQKCGGDRRAGRRRRQAVAETRDAPPRRSTRRRKSSVARRSRSSWRRTFSSAASAASAQGAGDRPLRLPGGAARQAPDPRDLSRQRRVGRGRVRRRGRGSALFPRRRPACRRHRPRSWR